MHAQTSQVQGIVKPSQVFPPRFGLACYKQDNNPDISHYVLPPPVPSYVLPVFHTQSYETFARTAQPAYPVDRSNAENQLVSGASASRPLQKQQQQCQQQLSKTINCSQGTEPGPKQHQMDMDRASKAMRDIEKSFRSDFADILEGRPACAETAAEGSEGRGNANSYRSRYC